MRQQLMVWPDPARVATDASSWMRTNQGDKAPEAGQLVVGGAGFSGWHALNDTIMGGRSSGACRIDSQGLHFDGELVEQGGGFVFDKHKEKKQKEVEDG